jgi:hypothetical protein
MSAEHRSALHISVDYSAPLRAMIDAGHYDEISKHINPRTFRLEKAGTQEIDLLLVQFRKPLSPLEIINRMRTEGFRPGAIEELLSLGSARPELQRSIPIVGLGSPLLRNGSRWFPSLAGNGAKRILTLAVIYRRWSVYHRFLFVRQ